MSRQIRSSDLKFRLALDEEGERIAELLDQSGYSFHVGLDWSKIHPHWVVAEVAGEIVACIQILHGTPIGNMDHLGVDASLSKMSRGVVVRNITDAGASVLRLGGSEVVASLIPFHLNSYKRVAKRRGWTTMATGNLMMKRT